MAKDTGCRTHCLTEKSWERNKHKWRKKQKYPAQGKQSRPYIAFNNLESTCPLKHVKYSNMAYIKSDPTLAKNLKFIFIYNIFTSQLDCKLP